ncbi:MAG: hypothetical protein QOD06_1433 [Candidatus Binatota bacterium]|nr:hypothetical protein [Candidatus Binatota bacterium]
MNGPAKLLLLLVAAGCAAPRLPAGSAPGGGFVDWRWNLAFDVPPGWIREETVDVADRPSDVIVRFHSPDEASVVVVHTLPLEGRGCAEALTQWMIESRVARVWLPPSRVVNTFSRALPTWRGAFEGEGETSRRGSFTLFCDGDTAIVLDASAPKRNGAQRRQELRRIADSVRYWDGRWIALVPGPKESPAKEPPPEPEELPEIIGPRL